MVFTLAMYVTLVFQFICRKGGEWHRWRALLIAIFPLLPIFWNLVTATYNDRFLSTENMFHVIPGIVFYYFWLHTVRLGIYASKHASSTTKHERSAYMLAVSALATFLLPFLWRYFMKS